MTRTEIINALIKKHNYKSYLEIGVQEGKNFAAINCGYKVGVDPDTESKATIHCTSDVFFENHNEKFDIIFIDGLHHADQVYKDISNALKALNKGGTIVCHDMNPITIDMQKVPRETKIWTGDCWRAFVALVDSSIGLRLNVVDTDFGCGIIQSSELCSISFIPNLTGITYSEFNQDRDKFIKLISVKRFKELYL